MKNQRGITLIALVITIIVMLILVAVTIRVATDGNLFTHAANAAKGTKSAIEGENAILNDDLDIEDIVATQAGTKTYTAYTVGQTVTIGENEEEFYVIEDSDENTSTVKLLAARGVDTSTNRQRASAGTVAFDSTEPYTNDYNATSNPPTIKGLVNSYVSSLGVTVQEGRLMTLAEVEALGGDSANFSTDGCRGNAAFVNTEDFWLGSPYGVSSDVVWIVKGGKRDLIFGGVNNIAAGDIEYVLRPVIVILKSNI